MIKDSVIGYVITEASTAFAKPKIVSDTGSVVTFDTILQDYEANRNKRIYGRKVIEESIATPRFQELLATRTLFGEANHPFDKTPERQMVVDQTRAAVLVTDINPGEKNVPGRVETLATAVGKDLRGMIVENKSLVAFSMRGASPVVRPYAGKPGLSEVCGPLHITAYDNVTYPSHKAAYMLTEGTLGSMTMLMRDEMAAHAGQLSENVQTIIELLDATRAQFLLNEAGTHAHIITDKGTGVVRLENHLARVYQDILGK